VTPDLTPDQIADIFSVVATSVAALIAALGTIVMPIVIWRKTLKIESNTDGAVKAAAAIRLELEKGNRALEERLRELIIKGQADKDLAAKAVTDVQAAFTSGEKGRAETTEPGPPEEGS
jgi:hypothetical protein